MGAGRRLITLLVVVIVGVGLTASADLAAQTPPPPDPRAGDRYDARAAPPDENQPYLILPRLLLAIPRVIYEAIFYPLGNLFRWVEKKYVLQRVVAAVTSPDGKRGVRPAFSLISDYRPMIGLSYFDYKTLGPGTGLNASVSSDLARAVGLSLALRPTHLSRAVEYTVLTSYLRRDDFYYSGIGMETARINLGARYSMDALQQIHSLEFVLGRHWFAHTGGSFVVERFGNGLIGEGVEHDLPIESVYCKRFFDGRCVPGSIDESQVPGFTNGTQFLRASAGLRLDTRDSFYRPTSGAALAFDADYSHGLGADDPSSYFRTRAAVEAVFDLWGRSRILVVRVSTDAVWPVAGVVPFTELPVLGGPDQLRGARLGKYRDYTRVLATAEYRWPVWMWMDAALFVDYGGVFGQGYAGFNAAGMIPDVGMSLRVRTSSSFVLALQGAYGIGEGWFFSFTGRMDAL